MKKVRTTSSRKIRGLKHNCAWREAALMLAKCVVATLQADGKIGVGSGLVMKVVDGERFFERWDKDFIEALAFVGIEMVDKKTIDKKKAKIKKSTSVLGRAPTA